MHRRGDQGGATQYLSDERHITNESISSATKTSLSAARVGTNRIQMESGEVYMINGDGARTHDVAVREIATKQRCARRRRGSRSDWL